MRSIPGTPLPSAMHTSGFAFGLPLAMESLVAIQEKTSWIMFGTVREVSTSQTRIKGSLTHVEELGQSEELGADASITHLRSLVKQP